MIPENIQVSKRYKLVYSKGLVFAYGEERGYQGTGLCVSDKEKGSLIYLFSEFDPKINDLNEIWFHADNIIEEVG